jgi:hypothetical protein
MSTSQLERCVELGEAILSGEADLQRLNEKSLEMRGKAGENRPGHHDRTLGKQIRSASSTSSKRKVDKVEPESEANPKRIKTQPKPIQDYFAIKSTVKTDYP